MHPLEVLRRPVVTEKSVLLAEEGKYVFHTHPNANKLQIKAAVAQAFDVTVLKVNTLTMPGKRRRSRQRGGYRDVDQLHAQRQQLTASSRKG